MRIIRFLKLVWIYFSHDADFMKKFPQSTKRRFITMIKTAWGASKMPEFPTQEELIEHRTDATLKGKFLQ